MNREALFRVLPGFFLCLALGGLAYGVSVAGNRLTGQRYFELFTCAIVLGIGVRSSFDLPAFCSGGIRFAAVTILEIAVFLLGFSLDFSVFSGNSLVFIGCILGFVTVMVILSFTICRAIGLPEHLAVLVACGNSICGNAAIAAVAPAVRACNEDVVAAITFSSILGVLVVVFLPLLEPAFGLNAVQFGTFAGLTVYAVPQVVAATAPVSMASAHIGTAVKLVRVLMLMPAVLLAPLLLRNHETADRIAGKPRLAFAKVFPWFIPAFLTAALANNLGLVPLSVSSLTSDLSRTLFVVAMCGLGLSVDLRRMLTVGPRLVLGITSCLAVLSVFSFLLARSLA
ncbi:putative integral membrane protein (TIGR00698 family) [Labrenzia sp. MBR-25]|jgi:uncharacterized integral membrane protein (TIGR00698 family)